DKPDSRGFGQQRTEDFSARSNRRFDKPAGKSWSKGPAQGRDETRESRPARPFRDDSRPRPGGGSSRPASAGRAKPAFGAKPGFKPGFKSSSKPGFKSGSKSGFKRGGPRPGGNRPGGRQRG